MPTSSKTIILNNSEIKRKLERIAYEILENNDAEKELYLIGIRKRGTQLARRIANILSKISEFKIEVMRVELNKTDPTSDDIAFSKKLQEFDNKVVIIVDDVANTGRTMCYAIKPLLDHLPKKIEVAVLVDREHKTFPIAADYVGLQLSTSLQEHIEVILESGKDAVFLT